MMADAHGASNGAKKNGKCSCCSCILFIILLIVPLLTPPILFGIPSSISTTAADPSSVCRGNPPLCSSTQLLPLAEFWLKLRTAVEQRANWYYAALFVALGAAIAGFEKLKDAGRVAQVIIQFLGVAGHVAGISVGIANWFDVLRANCIGIALSKLPDGASFGALAAPYEMTMVIAVAAVVAGAAFLVAMWLRACKLNP